MEEHRPKKLLNQVRACPACPERAEGSLGRDAFRLKPYSYRTKQAYVGWIKRYICVHDERHPSEMGAPEAKAFLTRLAVKEKVAVAGSL